MCRGGETRGSSLRRRPSGTAQDSGASEEAELSELRGHGQGWRGEDLALTSGREPSRPGEASPGTDYPSTWSHFRPPEPRVQRPRLKPPVHGVSPWWPEQTEAEVKSQTLRTLPCAPHPPHPHPLPPHPTSQQEGSPTRVFDVPEAEAAGNRHWGRDGGGSTQTPLDRGPCPGCEGPLGAHGAGQDGCHGALCRAGVGSWRDPVPHGPQCPRVCLSYGGRLTVPCSHGDRVSRTKRVPHWMSPLTPKSALPAAQPASLPLQ